MTRTLKGRSVLIIEDDQSIAGAVEIIARQLDLVPTLAADGREGLRAFEKIQPELVILDIGLPEIDGWQVLEKIRETSEVPILLLTAKDLEIDKVRGLHDGADDYMTKPFGIAELSARIVALLRRAGVTEIHQSADDDNYSDDLVTIDFASREVVVKGETVPLTDLEFRLLETFVHHLGQALSTNQLLELVWDDPYAIGPDRVKFTVHRLRRKLGWRDGTKGPLEAVRGYGYRYRVERS